MTPQFRFTFYNDTLYPAGVVVNQPLGWAQAKCSLTRDPIFHSLVEFFKGSFIWYGSARAVIRAVEDDQGPAAILRVVIDEYYTAWSTIFDGLLDISQIEDVPKTGTFYKAVVPIIRDDFWARVINRRALPADIGGAVDMDGNAIAAHSSFQMMLTSQKVRQNYERVPQGAAQTYDTQPVGITSYLLFDMPKGDKAVIDEVDDRFDYGTKVLQNNPVDTLYYYFKAKYGGDYSFNMSLAFSFVWTGNRNYSLKWFVTTIIGGVRTNTQIGATIAGTVATGFNSFGFNPVLATTYTLASGDQIFIYGVLTLSAGVADLFFIPYDGANGVDTHFTVQADTTFDTTACDVFNSETVWTSLLEKITGQVGCFESSYFSAGGCGKRYNLTKGACLRGYGIGEKPLSLSLDDLWKGFDPILNIGLGYKEVLGVKKIKVEQKSFFFNKTPAVFFDNVPNLVRKYDLEKIFRSITIGYKSWSTESGSGIDDPQTKHTYNSGFPTIGKDTTQVSDFYAASLGIEQARRNVRTKNNDYRLDEDIIIISSSPASGYISPELSENFASLSGLLNSNTRYNSRLTPAENFLRWRNYYNGCMQLGSIGRYIYSKGDGNTAMISQLNGGDCDPTDSKGENADIDITSDFLFLPKAFKCSVPMTRAVYNSILAVREKAVGISAGVGNYLPYFIIDMDFGIVSGGADFTLLLADETIIP